MPTLPFRTAREALVAMIDIFMVAGEVSGDILGGSILESLLRNRKDLDVAGIGGPQMRAHGLFPTIPMEQLQVMGFVDVIQELPHLIKIFRSTVKTILHLNPKVVVTIDYPGFNLRLAKALRKKGYRGKICHVVCPSVWAWGKKRIQTLAHYTDLLLTLLPFEKPLFQNTKLRVEYIGHPLAQKVPFEIAPEENLVALFPGSRAHEIERNLPYFLRLLPKLDPKLKFIISLSQEKYRPLIEKIVGIEKIADTSLPLLSPAEMNKRKPMFAIAKCGTIILELALKGIPTVVTYKISPTDVALARWIFRINLPYYSLPNLIFNRPLFPELIGPQLTDKNLFEATSSLLDPKKLRSCHLECQKVRQLLTADKDPASLIITLL
jgi:lipid-A-disaccharide synthase